MDETGHSGWRVLLWVRLDGVEKPSEKPHFCIRPTGGIDVAIRMEAAYELEDVIANRLDPWHSAHSHSYSYGRLRVIEQKSIAS